MARISNRGQFSVRVTENGRVLQVTPTDDPFIHTTITIQGWRARLLALFGRLTLRVQVNGTIPAFRVVFQGDYKPEEPELVESMPKPTGYYHPAPPPQKPSFLRELFGRRA